jgi:tRNA pseudouridine38-40 synthase
VEKNIKLIIEYDGTDYYGFQIQPEGNTVQGEIERSLSVIFQRPVKIYGAGRTDAGVHARGQVVNFKHSTERTAEQIQRALNGLLHKDIAVTSAEEVDENFHARYSAKRRKYKYKILNRPYRGVFLRDFAFFYPHYLNVELMAEACKIFTGTHDFTSFKASSREVKSNIRTIFLFHCYRSEDLIIFEIEADGFLHMMVRILTGTIIQAGRGRFSLEKLRQILEAKDRRQAGPTLPPHGLSLMEVKYE